MLSSLVDESTSVIDLSIGLEDGAVSEPWPPRIDGFDHAEGAEKLAENLRAHGHDVAGEEFPDGMGLAWEEVTALPHAGTHMDAPWHYGPETAGEPSRTIDEVPLEWCVGDAVVLDFTWKEPRSEISRSEVESQLEELGHDLSPGEIVLVETGA
ncbi:MAG: cyclase family protein, partial [Salinigranum sp.]